MKRSIHPAHSPQRQAIAVACLLAVASACQPSDRAADTAARDDSASASHSPTRSADTPAADRFVGKLLHEVVPDSAFWGSWGVYPLDRHIGLRVAQLADGWWLLADTLVGHEGPKALWRVRRARAIPAPRTGEAYVGSCTPRGRTENDGTIVARVTHSSGEALTEIHDAFRLDPVTWTLRPFPTDSLTCHNEGGGP